MGRVGFALTEGGGRRLRFTASDRSDEDRVDWCHIDAYDDVPLTSVVRTGEPVLGDRGSLDPRFDEFVAGQPAEVQGLAAVPLPGIGSPMTMCVPVMRGRLAAGIRYSRYARWARSHRANAAI